MDVAWQSFGKALGGCLVNIFSLVVVVAGSYCCRSQGISLSRCHYFLFRDQQRRGKKKCPDEGRLCWKFTCARSAAYPSSCPAFSIITAKTEKQLHTASQPSVVCSSLWDRYCLGNSPFHTDLVVSYHLLSHSVQTAAFTLVSPSARDSQQQEMQESCNSSIPHSQFSEMPRSGVCWTAKEGSQLLDVAAGRWDSLLILLRISHLELALAPLAIKWETSRTNLPYIWREHFQSLIWPYN